MTEANLLDLRGATPGGLPYPETTGPLNQGANDIKALALAADSALAGPWVACAPRASGGFSGSVVARQSGGNAQLVGNVSGNFAGNPTFLDIPVGLRPVFPPGSGLTYYQFILPALTSGVTAMLFCRVWASGIINVNGYTSLSGGFDVSAIVYPIRNA